MIMLAKPLQKCKKSRIAAQNIQTKKQLKAKKKPNSS